MAKIIKSSIVYYGGKGNQIKKLTAFFPTPNTYHTYVDPYGGGGMLLLNSVAATRIYNDLDNSVYNFWRVIQCKTLFPLFAERVNLLVYHEKVATQYKRLIASGGGSRLDRAVAFWYVNRTCRTASKTYRVLPAVRRGVSKSISDFWSAVDGLENIHANLQSVSLYNRDALALLKQWDKDKTFIYLDPPYEQSTRTGTRYDTDADLNHHKSLVATLLSVKKANVLLSGYDTPVYQSLVDGGWNKYQYTVNTISGTNKPKSKTETVWCNYFPPSVSEPKDH
jgi:DNA adenine methylase